MLTKWVSVAAHGGVSSGGARCSSLTMESAHAYGGLTERLLTRWRLFGWWVGVAQATMERHAYGLTGRVICLRWRLFGVGGCACIKPHDGVAHASRWLGGVIVHGGVSSGRCGVCSSSTMARTSKLGEKTLFMVGQWRDSVGVLESLAKQRNSSQCGWFATEESISDSPEVKAEYLSCLKHLSNLMGDANIRGTHKSREATLQELKEEIKHLELETSPNRRYKH
ncbi:hypothetical protein Patl1_21182 [Pistacia atlantica]|uniref:Uncharacterized protein n=1 Tax=Pistacia atlantica TaxID=434234 RepID=A0ACC1BLP1_9ROSI|nr:hypothetical protein Patl1_21182 [Pistacia atlantica]